jgi:hypothetical protein
MKPGEGRCREMKRDGTSSGKLLEHRWNTAGTLLSIQP